MRVGGRVKIARKSYARGWNFWFNPFSVSLLSEACSFGPSISLGVQVRYENEGLYCSNIFRNNKQAFIQVKYISITNRSTCIRLIAKGSRTFD